MNTRTRTQPTPLSRRALAGAAAAAALSSISSRAVSARLARTPAQATGPFYPDIPLAEVDANLRIVPGESPAKGTPMDIAGVVRDSRGQPVPGLTVEIWQCDASGRYRHSRDMKRGEHDAGFQGYGRTSTTTQGAYRFETIRPVAYPGRTPHVHFMLRRGDDIALVTQMYLPDEKGNSRDSLYRSAGSDKARLLATVTSGDGAQLARFDLVV